MAQARREGATRTAHRLLEVGALRAEGITSHQGLVTGAH